MDDIQDFIKAYKFALTESVRLYSIDKEAYGNMHVLGSLAHVYLLGQGVDADEINDSILGCEEDD